MAQAPAPEGIPDSNQPAPEKLSSLGTAPRGGGPMGRNGGRLLPGGLWRCKWNGRGAAKTESALVLSRARCQAWFPVARALSW
jgi:hypothetical protein